MHNNIVRQMCKKTWIVSVLCVLLVLVTQTDSALFSVLAYRIASLLASLTCRISVWTRDVKIHRHRCGPHCHPLWKVK